MLFDLNINYAQTNPPKTELIIIGTLHSPNKLYNGDSLYEAILKVKPDVLLIEADSLSGYFKKNMQLKVPTWKSNLGRSIGAFDKFGPEEKAMYQYLQLNQDLKVLPFDMKIADRNKFVKEFLSEEAEYFNAAKYAYNNDLMNLNMRLLYEKAWEVNKKYRTYDDSSLYSFNQPTFQDITRNWKSVETNLFKIFIDSISYMKKYTEIIKAHDNFWENRNIIMAENITSIVNLYQGKRIVVFVGVLHKYFLYDLLIPKQIENQFMIREYYNY
jgi:hypothetical protein